MELRYMVMDIGKYKMEELLADLECHNVSVIDSAQVIIERLPADRTLVMSESTQLLQDAKRLGMAVIQLELQEERAVFPVVVTSLDGIDFEWLNHIWQRAHKFPWKILETERCYLMELSLVDLDELYEIYEEPGMTDYVEPLYDRKTEEEYERAYIENMYGFFGYGMWLVREKKTNRLIGRAGLENHEYEGNCELELGYLIAGPYQRQGYAYEVCTAILLYAREYLDSREVHCRIEPENQASVALAKKLGFCKCGTICENGHLYDRYVVKLSKRDEAGE